MRINLKKKDFKAVADLYLTMRRFGLDLQVRTILVLMSEWAQREEIDLLLEVRNVFMRF